MIRLKILSKLVNCESIIQAEKAMDGVERTLEKLIQQGRSERKAEAYAVGTLRL